MKVKMMTNKISIGFTGDFSFSGYFRGCHKDEQLIDNGIFEFLNQNDANVINFESPITPCRMTKKKRLAHRSDPEVLDYVKNKFKNPILSLANNHMMDYGRTGMIDTLEVLQENEIPYIGAGTTASEIGKYQIVGNDNLKIGVFSIQYKDYMIAGKRYAGPVHDKRKQYIQRVITELKNQVDYVVLVYHGGDEFLHAPMPYFRKHLKNYLNMGCDLVVAHHPHVVQGYESFGKKMIFYSLGNFMFDTDYQRAQKDTDRGVILNISFTKEDYTFEELAVKIDRETCRVQIAEKDPYFKDVKEEYGKLWAMEAARKKEILANAAELKKCELEKRKTENSEKQEQLNAILEKYRVIREELQVDEEEEAAREEAEGKVEMDEESAEDTILNAEAELDAEKETTKKSSRRRRRSIRKQRRRINKMKKKLRKFFNKKTYEKAVIAWGNWKAKVFYNN